MPNDQELSTERFRCACDALLRVYVRGAFAGKFPPHTDDLAGRETPPSCVGSYQCGDRHRCNHELCREMCSQDGCLDTDARDLVWTDGRVWRASKP